jgi:hypothetical protein
MHEQIIDYIKTSGETGVSSIELAMKFLKFNNPPHSFAHRAIAGILKHDRRCILGPDDVWRRAIVTDDSAETQTLFNMHLCAVQCLSGRLQNGTTALVYAGAYTVAEPPESIGDIWVLNPQQLLQEDKSALGISVDTQYNEDLLDAQLFAFAAQSNEMLPVFLKASDHALLCRTAAEHGTVFTDTVIMISSLFIAAGMNVPYPLSLEQCYNSLFGRQLLSSTPAGNGAAFAECVKELVERMSSNGIVTMADLDAFAAKTVIDFDYSGKAFTADDILALPQSPGVYAFKKADNTYLYIGKSTNVKRRIMGYFGKTEESPKKLDTLRSHAHSMTVYTCGSDLESLLYEYRLIKKYMPELNTKIAVNERKGTYYPLQDCIILLPHVDAAMGMSCWYRKDQKIRLKPFFIDGQQAESMIQELGMFFYNKKLAPSPSDFPEQEIVFRWVKAHEDTCVIVPVSRMADAQEVYKGIRSYWNEVIIQ